MMRGSRVLHYILASLYSSIFFPFHYQPTNRLGCQLCDRPTSHMGNRTKSGSRIAVCGCQECIWHEMSDMDIHIHGQQQIANIRLHACVQFTRVPFMHNIGVAAESGY
jgi:hypothetical protein